MISCCVPGCNTKAVLQYTKGWDDELFALPDDKTYGFANPIKQLRRREWLKAINATKFPENLLNNVRVCSQHFVSGRPASGGATAHIDWVPSLNLPPKNKQLDRQVLEEHKHNDSVQNIITNLPEITEEFDVPEYITLDKFVFNEKKIESDLIHKYITNPVCDENGYYRNDHDYLGLPIVRKKTENCHFKDHNYSTNPACFYKDLRHFCNICQCNNLNLFTFNKHMMLHTINNDVTCMLCKQKFLTTTCLNNHMTLHTTTCDICGSDVPIVQKKAHQEANIQQMRIFNSQNKYKISNKEKVNFCIYCMKAFPKNYLAHMNKHKLGTGVKRIIGYKQGETTMTIVRKRMKVSIEKELET